MIGVVDYRAGNAPSVGFALRKLGFEHRLVADRAGLEAADRLVLPGVGAARATIDSLREAGLLDVLAERVRAGVPFLGICVGLQILFDHSEEGDTDGLGWLAGEVVRFSDDERVPQIGWNEVRLTRDHALVEGLPHTGAYCYFVNSYRAVPADDGVTLGRTDYGVAFASMVVQGNIAATQFHAEKSGVIGLRILENFERWDGR